MVTEQVAEVAEPVQPEVTEPVDPNPVPEAEAEQEDDFTDVLELLNTPEEGAEGESKLGTKASTPAKPKSEEEIRAEERSKVLSEANTQESQRIRIAQVEGMRNAYRQFDADIQALLLNPNLSEADRALKVQNRTAQHNGHYNELYKNDVETSFQRGAGAVESNIYNSVVTHVGKDMADEMAKAAHPTLAEYMEDFATRWAKKKGYIPPSEKDKVFGDGQRETLKRLKKLGIELPRGGEAKEIGSARSGPKGQMSVAQFEALPYPDQIAVPAAERARIYAAPK